jgi:hypothetical protein
MHSPASIHVRVAGHADPTLKQPADLSEQGVRYEFQNTLHRNFIALYLTRRNAIACFPER